MTFLSANQYDLSDRFAGKIPDIDDRFEGVQTETMTIDAPLLKGGLAYLNCRVMNSIPVGENTLVLAEVIAARGEGEGDPLVYHNRVFWKLVK
jgi:flavin reductase (DIM6/NTAB) family NADH-FMN oxidoreductase RutF